MLVGALLLTPYKKSFGCRFLDNALNWSSSSNPPNFIPYKGITTGEAKIGVATEPVT
jgi:hypothetical protein